MVKFVWALDELLMQAVKVRRPIYDPSDENFRKCGIKYKYWEEISGIVGVPVNRTMGGQQSIRASHFQRPSGSTASDEDSQDELPDDHHISISNKMVERLVEDAALAGGAAAAIEQPPTPRGDYKDKIYMEKLKCMDDSHSERTGLTIQDINSLANRIEYRTSNMISADPVCAEFKNRVIDCYNTYEKPEDNFRCWESVGEFTACVHAAGAARLRARTAREARDNARRTRHMQLARQHELRDLGPGPRQEPTPT